MEHNVPPSQDADSEELVRLPPQGKFIPTAQVDVASVVKFVPSIQLIPESEITSSALLTNIISEIELGDIDELVDAAEDSNRQLAETSDEEEPNGADPLSQHLDEADEEDYKMLLEEAKDFLPIERSLRRRRQPESYNPLKEGKLAAERFRTMKVTELTAAFLDKSDKDELDPKDVEEIAQLAEVATAAFIKEQDSDQDAEWYRQNVVQQDAKMQLATEVAGLLEHIQESTRPTDELLAEDVFTDESIPLLQLVSEQNSKVLEGALLEPNKKPKRPTKQEAANVFIVEAVRSLFASLWQRTTAMGIPCLMATLSGRFLPPTYYALLLSQISTHEMALKNFIEAGKLDDAIDVLVYQNTLDDMLHKYVHDYSYLCFGRIFALRKLTSLVAHYLMDNKVDRKSPEYHLLDTYCTVIEEMVSMLTEHLDIIDDWAREALGYDDWDEEDENEGDEEPFVPIMPGEEGFYDEEYSDEDDSGSDLEGFIASEDDSEADDDENGFAFEDFSKKSKLPPKNPTATPKATSPASKQTPTKTPQKNIAIETLPTPTTPTPIPLTTSSELSVSGDSSAKKTGSGRKKPGKATAAAALGIPPIEFKTLNMFSKDLQKTFLIPRRHLLKAVAEQDVSLVVLTSFPPADVPKILSSLQHSQLTGIQYIDNNGTPSIAAFQQQHESAPIQFTDDDGEKATKKRPLTLQAFANFINSESDAPGIEAYLKRMLVLFPQNRALVYTFLHWLKVEKQLETSVINGLLQKEVPILVPIATMVNGTALGDLIIEFYMVVYDKSDRKEEWRKDKESKHTQQATISKAELSRFTKLYASPATTNPVDVHSRIFLEVDVDL